MSWHNAFRIGNSTVAVTSENEACTIELKKMVALYQSSDAAPDITFSVHNTELGILLSVNEEPLWQVDDSGEICAAFEVHLYAQVMALLISDFISIHAACVAMGGKAVMFAGISGAGKSSWCTKAVLEGAAYLSDEFSLLTEAGDIAPFPRPLQWGQEEHPAFAKTMMRKSTLVREEMFAFPDRNGQIINNCFWLPERVQHSPLPLGYVIFPCFDADAPACEIEPVRRGEMLMELLQHLHHKTRPDIHLKNMNQYIPENVQAFRIRYSDVHRAWQELSRRLTTSSSASP